MITLNVNREKHEVEVSPDTPLLWVLRESLRLTGTKFGCGMAQCGACTVHLNGEAIRSCVTPVSRAAGKEITTIEGLSGNVGRALQQAWIAEDVPRGSRRGAVLAQTPSRMAGAAQDYGVPAFPPAVRMASWANCCSCDAIS